MPSLRGRVIVAGSAGAGKTCLLERFVRNVYSADEEGHGPTVGCDCLQKSVTVEDTDVTLFLYDTAGQERFADMSGTYYRQGDVCLLVFDVGDVKSWVRIKWWMEKVGEYNDRCSFVLVGCKEDSLLGGGGNESKSNSSILNTRDVSEDVTVSGNSTNRLRELLDQGGLNSSSTAGMTKVTQSYYSNNKGPSGSESDVNSVENQQFLLDKYLDPARKWADQKGMPFFLTSAKRPQGQAIQFLFYSVAEKCIRQSRERQILQQSLNVANSQGHGGGGNFSLTGKNGAIASAFGAHGEEDEDDDEKIHNYKDSDSGNLLNRFYEKQCCGGT